MRTLDGTCVLLLEDEFLVALDAEQILKDLGAQTVEVVSTLLEAEERVRVGHYDLALLDVNINGQMSFGLAEKLCNRGVPVVFATGYELKDRAIPGLDLIHSVSKPYTSDRLSQVLSLALASASASESASIEV
jgi:CheY-like chemotaxis protein